MKRKLLLVCLMAINALLPASLPAQAPKDLEDALTVGIAALHAHSGGKRAALAAADSVIPLESTARAAKRLGYQHALPTAKISAVDVVYEVKKTKHTANGLTFYVDAVYTEGTRVHVAGKSVSLARRGGGWVVTQQRNLFVT